MFSFFSKKQKDTGADMAREMFDNFSYAIENNLIEYEPAKAATSIWLHTDFPEGIPRMTYFMFNERREVSAVVQYVMNGKDGRGYLAADVSWCVRERDQRAGYAAVLLELSKIDLQLGFAGTNRGVNGLSIQAIVNVNNTPSNKLAQKILKNADIQVKKNEYNESINNYLFEVKF